MSKNIILLLFIGSMTLVFGADSSTVRAQDLQNMSTKERVAYINNFKERIALMSMDDRRKALTAMRIKMRLKHLPIQSKEYVQQMQNMTNAHMNMMQDMFQEQYQRIKQITGNATNTIKNKIPSTPSLP